VLKLPRPVQALEQALALAQAWAILMHPGSCLRTAERWCTHWLIDLIRQGLPGLHA
jgi:hypothetical protein